MKTFKNFHSQCFHDTFWLFPHCSATGLWSKHNLCNTTCLILLKLSTHSLYIRTLSILEAALFLSPLNQIKHLLNPKDPCLQWNLKNLSLLFSFCNFSSQVETRDIEVTIDCQRSLKQTFDRSYFPLHVLFQTYILDHILLFYDTYSPAMEPQVYMKECKSQFTEFPLSLSRNIRIPCLVQLAWFLKQTFDNSYFLLHVLFQTYNFDHVLLLWHL